MLVFCFLAVNISLFLIIHKEVRCKIMRMTNSTTAKRNNNNVFAFGG